MKAIGWQDLSTHSCIDLLGLALMASKLPKDISKFKIYLDKFGIKRSIRKSHHEFGEISVIFDHSPTKNCDHNTTMYVNIYMGRRTISAVVRAITECDYNAFCDEIQNAMFTYLCSIVESDSRLSDVFAGLTFPDAINVGSNWDPCITSNYRGNVNIGEKQAITVKNMSHDTMPVILKLRNGGKNNGKK